MNTILKTQKTILLLIIVMLTTIGYSQEKAIKHRYSESIKINQPAHKVWNVIADASQWKNWDKDIVDARFNGLIDKKDMGRLILPRGRIIDFKVVDVVVNESYTFFYRLSSQLIQEKIYFKRKLDIRSDGVYLTEKVWVRNISDENILKHLGDDYNATILLRLETLKEYIEGLK